MRLRGEVHLAKQGLEAGVGAEGVEPPRRSQSHEQAVPFLVGVFQSTDSLVLLPESQAHNRYLESRNVAVAA